MKRKMRIDVWSDNGTSFYKLHIFENGETIKTKLFANPSVGDDWNGLDEITSDSHTLELARTEGLKLCRAARMIGDTVNYFPLHNEEPPNGSPLYIHQENGEIRTGKTWESMLMCGLIPDDVFGGYDPETDECYDGPLVEIDLSQVEGATA